MTYRSSAFGCFMSRFGDSRSFQNPDSPPGISQAASASELPSLDDDDAGQGQHEEKVALQFQIGPRLNGQDNHREHQTQTDMDVLPAGVGAVLRASW